MKLLIEIPEKTYQKIIAGTYDYGDMNVIIQNGTQYEERPHGEWIDKGEYAECSICGANSGTQFDGVEPIPLKTNFCPNCGSDNRPRILDEAVDGAGKDGNVKEGEKNESDHL